MCPEISGVGFLDFAAVQGAVRVFIAAIERDAPSPASEGLGRWLEWARLEADRIDPLRSAADIVQALEPPDDWQPPAGSDRSPTWPRI